jgi:hypothetical protein
MACQPQARIDAFKRRFTIVHVTWVFMGRMKMLHWEYPSNSGFQAPKKTWWRDSLGDGQETPELITQTAEQPEEEEHTDVPSNPVSLREGIERALDRAYARNRWPSDDERDDGLISERDIEEWAINTNREISRMHERIAHQMAGIPTSSSTDSTTTSSDDDDPDMVHSEPQAE